MDLKKLSHGILGGSFILLVTINIFFILNYFFHFAMARMLSIENYGILVTLYSLIYILAIFTESIQLVISKYTTEEKDKGKVKNLLKKSSKKAFRISFYIFIIFLLIGIILSKLLMIDYPLIALTGLIIFSSFLLPITRGILQGKKKFTTLGVNMISEAVVKLLSAILLVIVGMMVYGAIVATLLGTYVSLLFSMNNLRDILNSKEKNVKTPGIYGYSAPVFLIIIAILLFYSLDVIMAKIFFSPEVAGYYAVASMISKVIFFGTQPISRAMFPLTTDSKNKNNAAKILKTSFLILGGLIVIALLVVYLVPDLLIRIFAGRHIPEISKILIYPAIAVSFVSLSNLTALYKLSQNKTRGASFLLGFILLEVILLSIFSSSLLSFSIAFLVSSIFLFLGTIVFLRK
ncbi:hypothetical protein CMI46_01255 [Candidatus Pacearchaeota archaeon]|nr:hypothetical protein [Candidatus Pacearchaeota archaeon]